MISFIVNLIALVLCYFYSKTRDTSLTSEITEFPAPRLTAVATITTGFRSTKPHWRSRRKHRCRGQLHGAGSAAANANRQAPGTA